MNRGSTKTELSNFGAGVGPRNLATPDLTRRLPALPASVPTRRQRSCKLHQDRRSGLSLNFAGFPLAIPWHSWSPLNLVSKARSWFSLSCLGSGLSWCSGSLAGAGRWSLVAWSLTVGVYGVSGSWCTVSTSIPPLLARRSYREQPVAPRSGRRAISTQARLFPALVPFPISLSSLGLSSPSLFSSSSPSPHHVRDKCERAKLRRLTQSSQTLGELLRSLVQGSIH